MSAQIISSLAFAAWAAFALDWLIGEPRRFHPLIGFGRLAQLIEKRFYRPTRRAGVLALTLLLTPFVVLAIFCSTQLGFGSALFSIWALYFSIGHKSLHDHVRPIVRALRAGDENAARQAVSGIVSRDKAELDIAASACETVLENGNDAVFAALFWFVVAGAPGALLYRLANTMDAMWGYKSERYQQFGWAAARFDDVLNHIPARLTALTYALLGNTRLAIKSWRTQAPTWDSPNAGPVMAAGAGALGVQLGGAACYQGQWHQRGPLGAGAAPQAEDIERALALVRHGALVWLLLIALDSYVY